MKLTKFNIEEEEVQMAPMIDMVFLLLIFFIVASHFTEMELIEIDVPVAKNAAVPEDRDHRRTITITADEKIYLGVKEHDLEDIGEVVEKERQKVPGLKIFLRADERLKHGRVRDVMKACAEAGAAEIIFATYEKAP
jgi:biopolymer transport protein ExbD